MKKSCSILFAIVLFSCKKDKISLDDIGNTAQSSNAVSTVNTAPYLRYSSSDYSQAIEIDTANRMIQSYITGIDYATNSNRLRSFSYDADTLRNYLANNDIKTLKFMLAHTQEYMNSGGYGHDGGMLANTVTVVIVGLNESDQYVYNNRNMVYDHILPCPTHCNEISPLLIK